MLRSKVAAVVTGVAVLSLVVVVVAAGSRQATRTYALDGQLSTRTVASLKDAVGAHGTLVGKLTLAGKKSTLSWTLTFRHLSGPVKRADIYYGSSGKTGTLALPLCVKCSTPTVRGDYVGSYVAAQAFVRRILDGHAYVIVRTKKNPNGEIRGQIKAKST